MAIGLLRRPFQIKKPVICVLFETLAGDGMWPKCGVDLTSRTSVNSEEGPGRACLNGCSAMGLLGDKKMRQRSSNLFRRWSPRTAGSGGVGPAELF